MGPGGPEIHIFVFRQTLRVRISHAWRENRISLETLRFDSFKHGPHLNASHLIIFKNSLRTAKKTPHFTVTEIDRLTLFKEIIAVYCENNTKPVNTFFG
jgi:hypothetical protein